jgi:hypothetical protein
MNTGPPDIFFNIGPQNAFFTLIEEKIRMHLSSDTGNLRPPTDNVLTTRLLILMIFCAGEGQ